MSLVSKSLPQPLGAEEGPAQPAAWPWALYFRSATTRCSCLHVLTQSALQLPAIRELHRALGACAKVWAFLGCSQFLSEHAACEGWPGPCSTPLHSCAGLTFQQGSGHSGLVGVPARPVFALQTLTLQRQMMENLVIAKAREETVSFPSCPGSSQGSPSTEPWCYFIIQNSGGRGRGTGSCSCSLPGKSWVSRSRAFAAWGAGGGEIHLLAQRVTT